MIIHVHPVSGVHVFTDYADAIAFADDIGNAYDLNHLGVLKSRAWLIHI